MNKKTAKKKRLQEQKRLQQQATVFISPKEMKHESNVEDFDLENEINKAIERRLNK